MNLPPTLEVPLIFIPTVLRKGRRPWWPHGSQIFICPYLSVSLLLSASRLSLGHALPPPQGHYTAITPAWGPTCVAIVVISHLVACNAPMKSVMKQVGSQSTFVEVSLTSRLTPEWICAKENVSSFSRFYIWGMSPNIEWRWVTQIRKSSKASESSLVH